MPTYDYQCQSCGYKAEIMQKISDSPLKTCPKCSKSAFKRGPGGGIGLHFKGSGFYKTDYPPTQEPATKESANCCPCGKNKNQCNV